MKTITSIGFVFMFLFITLGSVALYADSSTPVYKSTEIAVFCEFNEPEGMPELTFVNSKGTYTVSIESEADYNTAVNLQKNTPIQFDLAVNHSYIDFTKEYYVEILASNIKKAGDPKPGSCK
jgi:hypothetical protein